MEGERVEIKEKWRTESGRVGERGKELDDGRNERKMCIPG